MMRTLGLRAGEVGCSNEQRGKGEVGEEMGVGGVNGTTWRGEEEMHCSASSGFQRKGGAVGGGVKGGVGGAGGWVGVSGGVGGAGGVVELVPT